MAQLFLLIFSVVQIYLLIGLPACGKSQWGVAYAREHKEKHYMILGPSTVLHRSLEDPYHYDAEKDPTIYKNLALNAKFYAKKMLKIAPLIKHNYILDFVRLSFIFPNE